MEKAEIRDKILKILGEIKFDGEKKINMETNILLDLELDSLELVDFIILLEEELGIRFNTPFELIDNLESIKKLIDYCNIKIHEGEN